MIILFALLALVLLPAAAAAQDAAPVIDLTPAAQSELAAFYALRSNHAMWDFSDPAAIKRMTDFLDSLEGLIAYHGLEKSHYPIDAMRKLAASANDEDRKNLETTVTATLLRLAHGLHGDDYDLADLYPGWSFYRAETDIPALLNEVITGGTLSAFFQKLAPQNPAYLALANALQNYNALAAKGGWQPIAAGATLRPHDHDPRVTQLRARLVAEGYKLSAVAEDEADLFDDALAQTLKTYQDRNGLSPDGHLGAQTQAALNVPVAQRIAQIRANMERWRHMPENFPPDTYVIVNIPGFAVTIVEDKNVAYRGAVIDGRANRPTPFIDSVITNTVINPSWHVPVDIARKDILPKLQKDPHYLEKLDFIIDGRTTDPTGATIDWKKITPAQFNYALRQNPGDLNSLGQIKFNFANPFDVYMHGTPHQELFGKAERDFSSGCVRLEDPEQVAEILLAKNRDKGGWNDKRIDDTIDAGKTLWIKLARPMPVFFVYDTVFADESGATDFRKDIYGYDQILVDKMKE